MYLHPFLLQSGKEVHNGGNKSDSDYGDDDWGNDQWGNEDSSISKPTGNDDNGGDFEKGWDDISDSFSSGADAWTFETSKPEKKVCCFLGFGISYFFYSLLLCYGT